MPKKFFFIIILFCFCTCKVDSGYDAVLYAEGVPSEEVDSAWKILRGVDFKLLKPEEKAHFALVYTQFQYKQGIPVESDSLIHWAWNYYAGVKNELMFANANYYLGRICSDKDSLRKAVRYFVNAEQYALKERNYALLGRVYNELGKLHTRQYIVTEALEHYRKAGYYSGLAGDSVNLNYATGNIAKCFLHLNSQDSAWIYAIRALKSAERRGDVRYRVHLEEYFACFYLCQDEMPPIQVIQDTSTFGKWETYALDGASALQDTLGETYFCSLQYRRLTDSLSIVDSRNFIFKEEDKYRNEHLMDRNGILEIHNYRKTITLVILVFLVVVLILLALLVILHHKKRMKEKRLAIEEYTGLIEALKEENEVSRNSLMEKLNGQDAKEKVLKQALNKRLGIIRQLTDLSFKYGDGNKSRDIFCRKVKELMSVDILTHDVLADLLEIANLNYYGIIDFLKTDYRLSKEELELCSFLCAGFTPQEMSVLYNVNVNNIYVRCSRLGKKMGLQIPLSAYLKDMLKKLEEKKGK